MFEGFLLIDDVSLSAFSFFSIYSYNSCCLRSSLGVGFLWNLVLGLFDFLKT
jgi:hypothetical protein